uniref:Uncharacterized protein n=1 Tax=Brassica oleracea var. oleracea TaxID=109376 RepID=A0A0D3CJ32_BRAOL
MIVASSPDPHRPGDIARRDPLSVGGVPRHRSWVSVLSVDRDLQGVVEVEDHDGSGVGVEHGVGLGVAGDQDSATPLRRRDAGVGFGKSHR